jgi:hypothetical protein
LGYFKEVDIERGSSYIIHTVLGVNNEAFMVCDVLSLVKSYYKRKGSLIFGHIDELSRIIPLVSITVKEFK